MNVHLEECNCRGPRDSGTRFGIQSCKFVALLCSLLALSACGGSAGSVVTPPSSTQVATPSIAVAAAQNGAQIVTLSDGTSGASIYYSLDGSTPTTNSTQYTGPFLLASNSTLKVMAAVSGDTNSQVASQSFTPNIASGTLIWSDEFSNTTGANAAPNPAVWTYDTGSGGFGNAELEDYCAWGSAVSPCDTKNPNAYVGTDGYLHIVARKPSEGVYTSARMKTEGLFSFNYGRIEARMQIPEGQGLWPAFWMLGNTFATVNWPACGEMDIMEHIDAQQPDWVQASLHGPTATGSSSAYSLWEKYPGTTFASDFHTYGMVWSKNSVQYYVDSPSNVYASYTTTNMPAGGVWPFDSNGGGFVILNLAVGGNWPGSPNASTTFPSEVLVDYVRIYSN